MKKLTALLSIVVIVATLVGCQTSESLQKYNEQVDEEFPLAMKVPVYLCDRLLDLTDIVQVNLGFGDGFLVNAHATKWFQLGAGYRDGVCFGLMPRSFGMWYEDRTEGGIAIAPAFNLYYKNYQREALWGTTTLFDHDIAYSGIDHMCNETAHWADFGLSLHLFLIGADVNLSPSQAFDFVAGFFGMPFLVPIDPIGFGSEVDTSNDDFRARKVRNNSDLPYFKYTLD